MKFPPKVVLYFDGSCLPKNPGGVARFAWVLLDADNMQKIGSYSGEECRGPLATNNIAEWAGLSCGVRYLKENGFSGELHIRGDSQLVIRQLNGEYKVRKRNLLPYFKAAISDLESMDWSAAWVPREENKEADALSRPSSTEPKTRNVLPVVTRLGKTVYATIEGDRNECERVRRAIESHYSLAEALKSFVDAAVEIHPEAYASQIESGNRALKRAGIES